MSEFELDKAPVVVIETSAEVGDVFAALAKAQGEIKDASRDAKNDHFRSKYATLTAVWEACRAPLSKHGIAVIQAPYNEDGDVGISTTLGVASGQWMRGKIKVQPTKYDAQAVGSVMTYLRRYALAAMVGVAPDDDDGEAAVGRPADRGRQGAQQTRGAASDASRGSDRGSDNKPPDDRKERAQAAFNRLNAAIKEALDHEMLNDIETKMSGDIEVLRELSRSSLDLIEKRIGEKHAAITDGVVTG